MLRCRRLRSGLAAVVFAAFGNSILMRLVSHGHRDMCGLFSLLNGHRSAALKGQHRDREPEEKSEDQTHCSDMVPQIKSVHQGTTFSTFRPRWLTHDKARDVRHGPAQAL